MQLDAFKTELIETRPFRELFRDHTATGYSRPASPFDHAAEPVGDYVLERGGKVVATGGLAFITTLLLPTFTWRFGKTAGKLGWVVFFCRD